MPLVHRKVPLNPFVADPDVAAQQIIAVPQPADFPGIVVQPGATSGAIVTSGAAKVFWWGVVRDSDAATAVTVDASGFTFDAQLVAVVSPTGIYGTNTQDIVSWPSILGGTGALGANGAGFVESDVPFAIAGYLRVISVAGVPGGTPFLWLSFETSVLRSD